MATCFMTQAEFENQVWPLREKLYRIALYMLQDEDGACDAAQHIMVKVWNKRNELKQVRNMEAFMVTSVKNYCLDSLKARQKEVLNGQDHLIQHGGYEIPEYQSVDSDDKIILRIKRIVDNLPEKQRQVMMLRDLEGMDMEEIEEITGMKCGTIRVNLSRARQTVREKLIASGDGNSRSMMDNHLGQPL